MNRKQWEEIQHLNKQVERRLCIFFLVLLTLVVLAIVLVPRLSGQTTIAPFKTSLARITSNNQELYGPDFASPEAAVAAACAQSNHEVYFPAGVYPVASGMQACTGLHIRCTAPSLKGTADGTLFRLQPGAAVWGLFNPGANLQVTPGAGAIHSIIVETCGFDISQDTSALGAIQQKGISSSNFWGNSFFSNNNPNPVITRDGGNFSFNFGDYDNTWVGNNLFDNDAATGSDVGVYDTCTQTSGGSNNNTWMGGSIVRYGTEVLADCGNNNTFISVDLENWHNFGARFTTRTSPSGAGGGNHLEYPRLEGNQGTGIQIDSGAVGNTIVYPQWSGAFTWTVDANPVGVNPCLGCLYGTNSVTADALLGTSTSTPFHNVGVGKIPDCADGWNFNCFDVAGEIAASRNYLLGVPGAYHTFTTQASAPRAIAWPDLAGSPFINGQQVMVMGPQNQATPGTNYPSFNSQWTSSYFSGALSGGAYNGGGTFTGTIGQTCNLASFNGGITGATATVALTGTNAIAAGTSLTITAPGSGATSNPTTATLSNGTATCSGTATVVALATAADTIQCENAPGSGTSPSIFLICQHSGSPGPVSVEWQMNHVLLNGIASTAGANQAAPFMDFIGQFQNGSAVNNFDHITCTPTLGTGQNPISKMVCGHSGSSGASWWQFPGVSINGGTPITSTSSTGTQAVTCPPGGTGVQYCGADGAWH